MSTDKIKSLALDTVNEFCEWYFDGSCDKHNIGDDYFGIWGLNDEFWDFGDIVRAIGCKDLVTPDQLAKRLQESFLEQNEYIRKGIAEPVWNVNPHQL